MDGVAVVLSSDHSLPIHCIQDRLVLAPARKRDQRTELPNGFKCHNQEELITVGLYITV